MKQRRTARGLAVGVLLLGVALGAAGAAADEVPGWAYEMAGQLMSPFCPGVTLSECPSPQAESVRMWILEQAGQGVARADIEQQLFLQYGDQIRPTPRPEGLGLAAYAIPVVAFLAGGAFLAWMLRRMTRAEGGAG